MKKFAFRLESYLSTCRYREEAERLKLAGLHQELGKLQEARTRLIRSLERNQDELSRGAVRVAYEATWYVYHIHGLRQQIEAIGQQIRNKQTEIEQQQERLIEARRKLRPVEKLRERREESHRKAMEKLVDAEVSELYLQRLHRRRD